MFIFQYSRPYVPAKKLQEALSTSSAGVLESEAMTILSPRSEQGDSSPGIFLFTAGFANYNLSVYGDEGCQTYITCPCTEGDSDHILLLKQNQQHYLVLKQALLEIGMSTSHYVNFPLCQLPTSNLQTNKADRHTYKTLFCLFDWPLQKIDFNYNSSFFLQ